MDDSIDTLHSLIEGGRVLHIRRYDDEGELVTILWVRRFSRWKTPSGPYPGHLQLLEEEFVKNVRCQRTLMLRLGRTVCSDADVVLCRTECGDFFG